MKKTTLLAAGFALATGPAMAQGVGDIYGFVYGGLNFESTLDTSGVIGGASQTVDTDFDNGFNFGIGVGTSFGGGFRGEVELNFSQQDADQIFFSGNGPAAEVNVGGGIRSTALFVNGFYDIETNSALTPYVGAGIGYAYVEQDLVYGPGINVSDSDNVFAGQLILGASYDVSDTVAITGDVRYRRLFDVESNRFTAGGVSTGVISGDYDSVSVNLGVRFSF